MRIYIANHQSEGLPHDPAKAIAWHLQMLSVGGEVDVIRHEIMPRQCQGAGWNEIMAEQREWKLNTSEWLKQLTMNSGN